MIKLLNLLLFIILGFSINAANLSYKRFENITLESATTVINSIEQDARGMIWIGSNKGLYNYDGYRAYPKYELSTTSNTRVNCLKMVNNKHLYLGTDDGVLIYDIIKDQYLNPDSIARELSSVKDVRSIFHEGDDLWIGSLDGIYRIDITTGRLYVYKTNITDGLNNNAIYSIIGVPGYIYFGTYNGLTRYNKTTVAFENVDIIASKKESNFFVNSLLYDESKDIIWIGTEGELYTYNHKSDKIDHIEELSNNSIKTLVSDVENRLLIGTDNGLFVYENNTVRHIKHDSRMSESLANDIIWALYKDYENNIWIGTDYGISLNIYNKYTSYIPVSAITGASDGNHFYSIFKDSKSRIWLGGTNGLIKIKGDVESVRDSKWYRPGNNETILSHNRVRHIYQDNNNGIWVATDGSVNYYNERSEKPERFNIVDSTFTRNSNWAYNFIEDNSGKLWIATCMGGIFVVDKDRLLKSKSVYIADENITIENGPFINQLVKDAQGDIWALLYNNGIFKIDKDTYEYKKIGLSSKLGIPNYIMSDVNGSIWATYQGGIIYFEKGTETPEYIVFGNIENCESYSMAEVKDEIWISTSEGLWAIDKLSRKSTRIEDSERIYTSLFYDSVNDKVYMGYVNGVATTRPEEFKNSTIFHPVYLTALYVNNELIDKIDDKNISYIYQFTFADKQNHLVFEFSDLPYSQQDRNRFVYMLEDVDNNWSFVQKNSNQITFNSLNHGSYKLKIRRVGLDGKPLEAGLDINFRILPPWYLTILAKCIYCLLFIGFIIWIIKFFSVRHRLEIEHKEKEQILLQTKQKTEFFANISHEFKTPLSMIIAPVSRLLITGKDKQTKQQLEIVQRNALKLNSIIHKIIEFDRIDSDNKESLILSSFNIIELAENILIGFEQSHFKEKNITVKFDTNVSALYIDADMVKIESVITNLLSNSVKYSNENTDVELSIKNENNELTIIVSDNGIGIPERDLPFVTQRFFQSSLTAGNKNGTGIGLYLVKNYVELHHGTFSISSIEGEGTTVNISIPLPSSFPELSFQDEALVDNESLPLALICDDNVEMTTFIKSVFVDSFRVITAANGKEGISIIEAETPDIIITDLMMPEVDGLEMCKYLRKNIRTSTTPIIMLTANDGKNVEIESLKLSIDAFITKPFDANTLLLKAQQLIKKMNNEQIKQRIESITKPKEIIVESTEEKFLSQITSAIENRIDDPDLNVTSLCEHLQINNKQVYRKLKQLTGMSPVEYIKTIRLKKAAMLLSQNKFTISEIVYMVGFSNPSYFSKCFQNEFGKTPKQYIEEEVAE